MNHSRYLLVFAFALLAVVALTGLVNRAVNPYSVFAADWIKGKDKPETFTHLRMVKAAQVRHAQPQAIILGSSRAETGIPTDHSNWSARPVYNLGLSDASIYEVRRYFEHACAVAPVRQAVLLLDYSAFIAGGRTAPDFREDRLAIRPDGSPTPRAGWFDATVALGSWDALIGSFSTLLGRPGEKRYLPDGSRDALAEDERVKAKGGVAKAFAAYEKRAVAGLRTAAIPVLGTTEFDELRAIFKMARTKGVDLRMAIAPMHARYLELLDMSGQWPLYEEWKRQVVQAVETEASTSGRSPFVLADFSGYNSYTTEAVPQRGLAQYYYEASHFTMRLGAILLDHLLVDGQASFPPGAFGVRLSSAMIAPHLEAIRIHRESYRSAHGAELAQLRGQMSAGAPQ